MKRSGWLRVGAIALSACMGSMMSSAPPEVDAGGFREVDVTPPRVVDTNPDPKILEFELEAKVSTFEYLPGKPTEVWTYNGGLPGPLIEAHVGDRVIVHFRNSLPEKTTIHWHGVRVPSAMDGAGMMHDAIPAGGAFTYDFTLPDAGLFWYHPHARTDVQVEKGLYGAFLVHGDDDVPSVAERVLLLDDVLVNDQGQLPATSHNDEMLGREGNVPLVNGHPLAAIGVRSGSWARWRLVNTGNARYLHLTLAGAEFVRIGTDGGWLSQPERTPEVELVPGGRADVLVHFTGAPGSVQRLTARGYTRGHGIANPAFELLELRTTSEATVASADPTPARLATITPLVPGGDVQHLKLEEQMDMSLGSMKTTFSINGQMWPNVTPVSVALGRTDTWSIENASEMDHPFHLHGFFFQPLRLDGAPLPLEWRDTINVPAKQTLDVAVRYDDHAGMFPFHCHILEHAELGMMGMLEVNP